MRHPVQLDPNRAGKQAEDLQKKLRGYLSLTMGINQIVHL
jgi:hypothetical protein